MRGVVMYCFCRKKHKQGYSHVLYRSDNAVHGFVVN